MAINFKYKAQANYEYAPGYVSMGSDGDPGAKGANGNNLYFSDFDLDNSYDMDLALQKIENNYLLSNIDNVELKDREYKAGDIILSSNGCVYRIKEPTSLSLYKNYKFDLEYMGRIHKESYNDISEVRIYDFTGCEIYDSDGNLLRRFHTRTKTAVPNHRDMQLQLKIDGQETGEMPNDDTSPENYGAELCADTMPLSSIIPNYTETWGSDRITNTIFALYGAWIKVIGISTSQKAENVQYSFKIDLRNIKYIQGNSQPETYSQYTDAPGCIRYEDELTKRSLDASYISYVPLEFSNIPVFTRDEMLEETYLIKLLDDFDYTEVNGERKYKKGHVEARYLSDYSMDRMHPSGNNIKYTIDSTGSFWYRSGIKSDWDGESSMPYQLKLGWGAYVDLAQDDTESETRNMEDFNLNLSFYPEGEEARLKCDETKERWGSGHRFANDNTELTVLSFPKYAIGDSLTAATAMGYIPAGSDSWKESSMVNYLGRYNSSRLTEGHQKAARYQTDHIIQFERHYEGSELVNNFKSGDSAYFSGIHPKYVADAIFDYLTSSGNNFYVMYRDVNTKEYITSIANITVNKALFKNKKFMVFHTNGKVTSINFLPDDFDPEAWRA